jgi:MFS family permease
VSPVSGILFDRIGARFLTTSGLAIAAFSLFCICLLTENSSAVDIAWRLALLGCGQALFLSPNSAEVLASVSTEQVGISSGLLATARNLGMLAGVTLAGLLFGLLFSYLTGGDDLKQFTPEHAGSFMTALIITFGITSMLSLTGAVLSGLRQTVITKNSSISSPSH